ncbi:MAG: hypothetical protein GY943_07575, partial [Chloroflexi bacterium]|nr:hypothetical protein [Chloroflexota bacterium]
MNTLSAAAFQRLEEGWQSLAHEIGLSSTYADIVWPDIVTRYGENGRYYHTLTHIQHVLETAKTVKSLAQDWTAVQLAIWFHDIIYDPQSLDNEEKSAAFAAQTLQDCANIDIEKVQ